MAGMPSREERRNTAVEAVNSFIDIPENKIFIPRHTTTRLDEIDGTIRHVLNEFHWSVDGVSQRRPGSEDVEKWVEVNRTLEDLSRTSLFELEDDFRRLLGDEIESAH